MSTTCSYWQKRSSVSWVGTSSSGTSSGSPQCWRRTSVGSRGWCPGICIPLLSRPENRGSQWWQPPPVLFGCWRRSPPSPLVCWYTAPGRKSHTILQTAAEQVRSTGRGRSEGTGELCRQQTLPGGSWGEIICTRQWREWRAAGKARSLVGSPWRCEEIGEVVVNPDLLGSLGEKVQDPEYELTA